MTMEGGQPAQPVPVRFGGINMHKIMLSYPLFGQGMQTLQEQTELWDAMQEETVNEAVG